MPDDTPPNESYDALLARVRLRQYQAAAQRVVRMRAELVRLGVTDSEILGELVLTLSAAEAVPAGESYRWEWDEPNPGDESRYRTKPPPAWLQGMLAHEEPAGSNPCG